jgi:hypothetical protein
MRKHAGWRWGALCVLAIGLIGDSSGARADPASWPAAQVTLQGRGQQMTPTFPLQAGLAVVALTHNGSRNFIAALLDGQGNRVQGLANVIGPFDGSLAFGIQTAGDYVINVNADGDWAIRVTEPSPVAETSDAAFAGSGPTATPLFALAPGLRRFTLTHAGSRNFIATLLDGQGARVDGLVNVIGPFDGSKGVQIRQGGVYLVSINADGAWTLAVE